MHRWGTVVGLATVGLALFLVAVAAGAERAEPPVASGRSGGSGDKFAAKAGRIPDKGTGFGKNKLCCGYPLSEDLGFALRFYWLAMEQRFIGNYEDPEVDIYTRRGSYLGTFPQRFVKALRMEGSGLLTDGRVLNFAGRCRYGTGVCFRQLDPKTHPYGRGAYRRPIVPYRSVAVDPTIIPIGEPLYVPELDGLILPDGRIHDGCVRADDTGGRIKQRKMDFFVISWANFRFMLFQLWGVTWATPHLEAPRCEYLRQN